METDYLACLLCVMTHTTRRHHNAVVVTMLCLKGHPNLTFRASHTLLTSLSMLPTTATLPYTPRSMRPDGRLRVSTYLAQPRLPSGIQSWNCKTVSGCMSSLYTSLPMLKEPNC